MTRDGAALPGPDLRLVFWELTARCNLKCQHCRAEAQADFVEGELTTEEILAVAQGIRETADPIIVLTGGEPLAREDFFDIARACTRLFTRVAMATNGVLVDDGVARAIVDSGIQRVSISLDGATPEIHDEFRGLSGSFHAALQGLDALKRVGSPLQINMTVTKHNVHQLPSLLDLALGRQIDALHVFMLVPVGCGAEISDEKRLGPERFEETLRWLAAKTIELKGRIQIKATCAPQYYRIMREMSGGRSPAPAGTAAARGMHAFTRGCLAGSAVCFVSRVGDVQPCGYLPIRVGNVRERKLGAIWSDSEVFAALRDPKRLKRKCGACGYRKLCQGCRARAFAATGDYLDEEPDCPYVPPEHAV